MDDKSWGIVYLFGLGLISAIRLHFARCRARRPVLLRDRPLYDSVLLVLPSLGMFFLPLVYVATDWLVFADYRLSFWSAWVGLILYAAAGGLLWRAHRDLGDNWAPSIEIMQGQQLVTWGVYGWMRHPIYAAHWLWALAEVLLIRNWLVGLSLALTFLPLYATRVGREERLMERAFGRAYQEYEKSTRRLLPCPPGWGWRKDRALD